MQPATRIAWTLVHTFLATAARAQFSPGPLSRAHADLEGSASCLRCHAREKQVDPQKCFICHSVLHDRVTAGAGLHARADHRDCRTCHMEHQGEEFELVFWGAEGRSGFDHRMTGWTLAGRHGELRCDDCHHRERNREAARLEAEGFDADRSYLGLDTTCASCHADPHGGKFSERTCDGCHGHEAWRPATGFDHAETGYPLTGRHGPAPCQGCHRTRGASRPAAAFDAAVPKACASCHEDVHEGRLGTACQSCHTPAGWRGGTSGSFDHDLTRYPLAGLHQDVACQACHPAGRSHRRPFDRCTRCHVDTHRGELADRSDGGACEACHDVFGFRPSHFDVPDHRGTGFPLEGGHLAVPCDACHRQLRGTGLAARVDVRRNRRRSGSPPTLRLRFASTGCRDCHADPHAGGVDRYMAEESCEACHVLSSWRAPGAFDHSAVGYPLLGRHAQAACGGCHPGGEGRSSSAPVAFTGVAAGCHDCHEDPHRGQLSQSFSTSPCARCHTPDAWNALLFDHSRDSSYPLDGAHLNVECPACHRAEDRDGATVVRYKPLETTCVSCHGLRPVDAREGEP